MKNYLLVCLIMLFLFGCSKSDFKQKEVGSYSIEYSIVNGAIHFDTREAYEKYLGLQDKRPFITELQSKGFISLYQAGHAGKGQPARKKLRQDNNTGFYFQDPWYMQDGAYDLAQILNADGVAVIADMAYMIDGETGEVFTLEAEYINDENYYQDLISGSLDNVDIGLFPTDMEVLDAVQYGILDSRVIDPPQLAAFCFARKGAKGDKKEPAIYFLDETWPQSVISNVTNDPGNQFSSNTRIGIKLEYLKLGIFFALHIKAKYQREDGTFAINGDEVFVNKDWLIGEGRWTIEFEAKYMGKCKKYSEVVSNGLITPPLNNENKARKVFWESANALHKYHVKAIARLYTRNAWNGWDTEAYHWTEQQYRFQIPVPRTVNSLEIHPFKHYELVSNY